VGKKEKWRKEERRRECWKNRIMEYWNNRSTKIPNHEHQITNNFQITNSNDQTNQAIVSFFSTKHKKRKFFLVFILIPSLLKKIIVFK